MPKKKHAPSGATKKPRYLNRDDDEMFGIILDNYGGGRMLVKGEDGIEYMGILRGKIKKRVWCRIGDVCVLIPWDFETKTDKRKPKAYIIWRYTKTQVSWLERKGIIKSEFIEELFEI